MVAATRSNDRPTPTVSLSLAQAAADLNTTALSVSRLIARGRLKATRLGAAGQWRILPAELTRFIGAGAPDLETVTLDGAGWLADWPQPLGNFEEAIADAAQKALEDDPAALQGIAGDESEVVEYTVPIVGTVLDVARQELPGQLAPVKALRERFSSWAALWLAKEIRLFARQIVSSPPKLGTTPAARFYATPDAYRAVVQAAGARLTAATITRTAWVDVAVDSVATKRPVKIVLRVDALMTAVGLRVDDVAVLAF